MEEAAAALAAKMKQTSREARSRRRELEQALAGEKVKHTLYKNNFITIMTSFSTYLPSIFLQKIGRTRGGNFAAQRRVRCTRLDANRVRCDGFCKDVVVYVSLLCCS